MEGLCAKVYNQLRFYHSITQPILTFDYLDFNNQVFVDQKYHSFSKPYKQKTDVLSIVCLFVFILAVPFPLWIFYYCTNQ